MSRSMNSRKAGFSYFVSEGLDGILSHGVMSAAAITVIAACLLITSTFSLVAYNVNRLIEDLAGQSEIVVYLDEEITRAEKNRIGERIRALDNVESAEFITKEVSFEEYLESLGDDAFVMEGLRSDNPLRDSYRIRMKDIAQHEETVRQLEELSGVASSNSSKEVSDRLVQIRRVTNMISYTLVILLGIVSVFIISNIVRLALFARREEIAIMRMVGATNHFIRAPFVVEGVILGLSAALLAFFLQWGVYDYMAEQLLEGTAVLRMASFEEFWGRVILLLSAAGLVMGVGGSTITIRRFLKV